MTICQALLWAREKLNKSNVTSAELDTEVILGYVLRKTREWILINSKVQNPNYSKSISKSKCQIFKNLINKRAKGVPVAYLTKHKEFFWLDFYVDERVLIPRPETEMLVQETLETWETRESLEAWETLGHVTRNTKHLTIVDVGTGSGCIAISIATSLMPHDLSLMTIYATDISKDALVVARKNAKRHEVDIKFLQGDLLMPLIKRKIRPDIIVANLPYLRPEQINGDIKYEPRKALDGGKEGLKYYEELFKQIVGAENFQPRRLIFEIDPSQTEPIRKLIKKYLPKSSVQIKKDLAGLERLIIITIL